MTLLLFVWTFTDVLRAILLAIMVSVALWYLVCSLFTRK